MRRRWFVIAPMAVVGLLLFIALGGAIVQLLWNWLLPPLFGLPLITFWQAVGLLALCRILFGGSGRQHYPSKIRQRVAQRVAERWDHMTPEEQERVRQRIRERCGFPQSSGEGRGP